HDVGQHNGLPFFSMELCTGGNLSGQIKGPPWQLRPAAELVATLASAVKAAHDAGIIHRDLKPANVLFTADGIPKLTDFGLAKRLDASGQPTATGVILGTPSYMASEQASGDGKKIGPAT